MLDFLKKSNGQIGIFQKSNGEKSNGQIGIRIWEQKIQQSNLDIDLTVRSSESIHYHIRIKQWLYSFYVDPIFNFHDTKIFTSSVYHDIFRRLRRAEQWYRINGCMWVIYTLRELILLLWLSKTEGRVNLLEIFYFENDLLSQKFHQIVENKGEESWIYEYPLIIVEYWIHIFEI